MRIGMSPDRAIEYTIHPSVAWKGNVAREELVYDIGGSCSVGLETGGEYILATIRDNWGDARVGLCLLNVAVEPAAPLPPELAFLGAGTPIGKQGSLPTTPSAPETNSGLQDDWPKLALLAATSLAAAATTLAVARRR